MANLLWAGASDNGTMVLTDTGASLNGDGTTSNPALFSAQADTVPGVEYSISLALAVSSPWPDVQVFAAFFLDGTYVSGDYPSGFALPPGAAIPASLDFTPPEGTNSTQLLIQLTGTPDSSVQLVVSGATLAPVPSAYDTTVHSGNLTDGAGLVTLQDHWGYLQVTNNDPANAIFVTTNGVTPTVGGDDCDCIRPGTSAMLANGAGWWHQGSPGFDGTMTNPGTMLSLVSASQTAAFSIVGAG